MAKELKKVNLVTVGVGFTGSIALAECAKAGLSVVGLERGERRELADFQELMAHTTDHFYRSLTHMLGNDTEIQRNYALTIKKFL
jgi:choline dehydrogenase-like flavoprotein